MPAYIKTKNSLVLHFRGMQKIVSLTDPLMPQILQLLKNSASAPNAAAVEMIDEELLRLVDIGYRITSHKSGLFGVLDGNVYVMGEKLPIGLSNRVLDFADNDLPVKPLLLFWENCKLNPDPRAKTDLYAFLEHNGHPITTDGCFMAYRYVKHEYKDGKATGRLVDGHTGTMDNSIGTKVTMPREDCDPNPNVTCSRGLHVATLNYAAGNSSGGPVVDVKVNPKDVVAIPIDYNGEKMRTCEFTVVALNVGILKGHLYDSAMEDDDVDSEDETGATSEASEEEVDASVAVDNSAPFAGLDFAKPQNVAESEAAKKIDTRENHKAQKRDSRGHFIRKSKPKAKSKRKASKKKK